MSNPGMWLEIRRGKTNFPLRPISGDRFLIGAGSHCHLQLGGESVPMLHSLLVIEGRVAHLEAVVAEPPLWVNGEARRSVELHDEDAVAIGDFEFVFHRLVAAEPVSHAARMEPLDDAEVSGMADLSTLSAAELVGLIEQEALQIQEFNRNREQGAASLLDAVRQAGAAAHPASLPMATFRPESSVAPLADREAECLRRAETLQAAQAQLAAQMAEFAAIVARWQETESQRSLRASA